MPYRWVYFNARGKLRKQNCVYLETVTRAREAEAMYRPSDKFRMEAAGSLTPELEGAPRSAAHPRITKEKGHGEGYDEARQKKAEILFLEKNKR